MPDCVIFDQIGPDWTRLDQIGPNWTKLDQIGPNWTTLERVQFALLRYIYNKDHKFKEDHTVIGYHFWTRSNLKRSVWPHRFSWIQFHGKQVT